MKAYGEGRYSSTVIDLCTRWRCVVSFTPRPLSLQGKSPRYPLDRWLEEPRAAVDPVENFSMFNAAFVFLISFAINFYLQLA
jgi:hypothetical protein